MGTAKSLSLFIIVAALGSAIALRPATPHYGSKVDSRASYTAAAEADRVTALPGAPAMDFGLFSGCGMLHAVHEDVAVLCN
jgi:hypothetical protein